MSIMKHVGKYGEKPCVVVFREVPEEPEHCLIVQTSQLADVQHDDLMEVVQSAEAQEANDISTVLNRRQFRDGENMLSSMHFGKKLQKVPVSQVNLTPTPSQSISLAEVNAEIRKIQGGYVAPVNDESHQETRVTTEQVEGTPANQSAEADEPSQAQQLVFQASLMKEDAERMAADAEAKLEEAYALDPSLKPKKRGRPKTKKA
jgi:hypothetical protein